MKSAKQEINQKSEQPKKWYSLTNSLIFSICKW